MDGFKPAMRKVFHSMRKQSSKEPIKVGDVSGLVSEHSVYDHGEECLSATTVKMAQGFVGANNLPVLKAHGHFGTRNLVRSANRAKLFVLVYLARANNMV